MGPALAILAESGLSLRQQQNEQEALKFGLACILDAIQCSVAGSSK
jgi:hypothetical protein